MRTVLNWVRPPLLLLAFAAGSIAVAAEPVFPPGSRIGLVPPAQMTQTRGLTGFHNPRSGAAILAVEMAPEAFANLAPTFTDEALKAQGFELASRSSPPVGTGEAILVTGRVTTNRREVTKSVLLATGADLTALVIGQLPASASAEEIAEIETALKSVTFRAPLKIDEQLAALPFELGERAGFRPVRAMAGNSLLLTDGPNDYIRDADQPVLIVAQSYGPSPPPDGRESFARQSLVATNLISEIRIERSQPFRQDGAEWHEIVAQAKERSSGTPVIVMQTIRFEPDGYVRSIGIVKNEQREAVLPRFRRIVDAVVMR